LGKEVILMNRVGLVMPQDVPTTREQLGKLPRVGYKWEAGHVDAGDLRVCFNVCLTREGWKVVREVYLRPPPPFGQKVFGQYGFGEQMEKRAKAYAVNLYRAMMTGSRQGPIPRNSPRNTGRTT
jgi:hypothetical protein